MQAFQFYDTVINQFIDVSTHIYKGKCLTTNSLIRLLYFKTYIEKPEQEKAFKTYCHRSIKVKYQYRSRTYK